jgi:hypothetical protein
VNAVIRLVLAVGVLGVLFAGVVLAALRGWRRRAERQTDIAPPPQRPAGASAAAAPGSVAVPALYVSSTRAGDWLDRVVVHGLGVKSRATVAVLDGPANPGIAIDRSGAPDLFIPAAALHAVRRDAGIAGKVAPRPELVVFTWDCGGVELDTGVRPGSEMDRNALAAAAADLIGER